MGHLQAQRIQPAHQILRVDRKIRIRTRERPWKRGAERGKARGTDQKGGDIIALNDEWLTSMHGLLEFTDSKGDKVYGSATMIGPKLAVTAARNLRGLIDQPRHFSYVSGINGEVESRSRVTHVWFPQQYRNDDRENYGLIELQTSVDSEAYGQLAEFKPGQTYYIAGYCCIKRQIVTAACQNIELKGEQLHYQTHGLTSGCGIFFIDQQGDAKVVGINVVEPANQKSPYFSERRLAAIKAQAEIESGWLSLHPIQIIQSLSLTVLSKLAPKEVRELTQKVDTRLVQSLDFSRKNVAQKMTTANWVQFQSRIGDEGVGCLSSVDWPRLVTLNLSYNAIGPQGASCLARAYLPMLQSMDLDQNHIGSQGAKQLGKASWSSLATLSLKLNRIGGQGAAYLARANLPRLQSISLDYNYIGPAGAEQLASACWPRLRKAGLQFNALEASGIRHLVKADWPQLSFIDLFQNEIHNDGARHLSKSYWPRLETIDLRINGIDAEGARYLGRARWPLLRDINLSYNKIGPQDVSGASWPSTPRFS